MRGNTRAVPLALAYMRALEIRGVRVLNGADVFALELTKTAQAALLRTLGIDAARITFNDLQALRASRGDIRWPGAAQARAGRKRRAHRVVESLERWKRSSAAIPSIWLPDNLFLLQEYCRTIPSTASCAWSSSAASCSTRCG